MDGNRKFDSHTGMCVLYLKIGSGHQMAAQALESAIRRETPELRIQTLDPLTQSIELLPMVLERLQAASIILTPAWADRVWRRGNPPGLTDRMLEFGGLQKLVGDQLVEHDAQIVAATHVLPCLLASSLKARSRFPEKVYGVVTDWGVHRFWPMTGVDGYFVAHEDVRQTLIYRGIDPGIVHVTGIPIRLGFEQFEKASPERPDRKLKVLVLVGGL